MKYKLFLLPSPPPYAGPEIANQMLLKTKAMKSANFIFLNSNIRKNNKDKGKLNFQGFFIFFKKYIRLFLYLSNPNIHTFYFLLSSSRVGYTRDIFYIFLAKLTRCKIIGHYRGSNFNGFYYSQHYFYKILIRYSLNMLDKIIVQGQLIKNIFKNIYPKEKIYILYNGIKTEIYQPKNYYFTEIFTIFFMGHLTYAKGFYDLVDAYKILYQKHGNKIRFIFAGENIGFKKATTTFLNGEWKEDFLKRGKSKDREIQNFITDSNNWNIEYLGFVQDKQKLSAFYESDLFVLPSYTEGFSMACLEAMAVGLPVITTPVGAMPEVVKQNENGLITEIGNPRKLAKDIEYFINNRDEVGRIGKNNSLYVRNNFDIEIIAQKLLGILEN